MSALAKVKAAAAELKAGVEMSQTIDFTGLNHWTVLGELALAIEELAASMPAGAPGAEATETAAADAEDKAAA